MNLPRHNPGWFSVTSPHNSRRVSVVLIAALMYWGMVSPARGQYFCGTCLVNQDFRPISRKIHDGDAAAIVICRAVTPEHPELYTEYLTRKDELESLAIVPEDAVEEPTTSGVADRYLNSLRRQPGLANEDRREEGPLLPIVPWRTTLLQRAKQGFDETAARAGTSICEIVWIAKGPAKLRPRQQLLINDGMMREPGKMYLVLADWQLSGLEWQIEKEVSQVAYDYLLAAPLAIVSDKDRIDYYARYVDSADPLIQIDAFRELALIDESSPDLRLALQGRSLQDVREEHWKKQLEPDRGQGNKALVRLIESFGQPEDTGELVETILRIPDDFDSDKDLIEDEDRASDNSLLIFSYLCLGKSSGLDELDERIMKNVASPHKLRAAYYWAVHRLGDAGAASPISRERLARTLPLFLKEPELAEFVINDLTAWHQWSSLEQIAGLFGVEGYDAPPMRRAIINHLLAGCYGDVNPYRLWKNPRRPGTSLWHLAMTCKKDWRAIGTICGVRVSKSDE